MIWLYKNGAFTPIDEVPDFASSEHIPCSSLEACRSLLSADDETLIETASLYAEGSMGAITARRMYMAPQDLGQVA